jgi:hypothetical protein
VTTSTAVMPWTLTMPAGSLEQWLFTFTTINVSTGQSVPYPISGATWEYVARNSATDTSPGGLFSITTTPNSFGVLTVTSSATVSQVQLTINPAATVNLVPQTYYHTLWMNPSTVNAYTWVTGNLIIAGNPQP